MLRFLLEKEFKQIFRNKVLPRLVLGMPIMVLFVLPWVADQELRNANVTVVDNDHSPSSRRLVEKIVSSDFFHLASYCDSYDEALATIESGDADAIVEIGDGFEKDVVNRSSASVAISVDGVNGTLASLSLSYLSAIISDYSAQISPIAMASPIAVVPNYLYNSNLDYKVFMIPALMVMLLTLLTGFLPALNIVYEKEKGTIEQINVSPVGKLTFTLSKLIPYWVIGGVVLTISLSLAALVYGLVPSGSFVTIYLFSIIYIFVVSGFGIVVSNYSATMQQAMFVMYFFLLLFVLLSGLFSPISSMPETAQWITYINPLRYYIEAMRSIYLKGSNIFELSSQIIPLLIYAVVVNAWALVSYRKQN